MGGLDCFLSGFSLIRRPGLRRWVVIPIGINTLVLVALAVFSFSQFDSWVAAIMALLPEWAAAVSWLVRAVALLLVLVLVFYLFTFIANVIAAPFNAILSIKVEEALTGRAPVSNVSPWMILPRTVAREVSKLLYLLPRLLGLLLVTLVPVVNALSPLLWILFSAWMMSIQYADYAADNNDLSFGELRRRLGRHRLRAVAFGLPAYLLLTIPLVNLVLMPVGVAGGTRFWVECLRDG